MCKTLNRIFFFSDFFLKSTYFYKWFSIYKTPPIPFSIILL
nr:MAG TPA: hypothetical protein [Crassvirales sp.]